MGTGVFLAGLIPALLWTPACSDLNAPMNSSPRLYQWSVDTLDGPELPRAIWASSPHDMYIVGYNTSGMFGLIHSDGRQWSKVALPPLPVSYFGILSDVYGFASNDVYVVGKRSINVYSDSGHYRTDSVAMYHFDGVLWNRISFRDAGWLTNIWGIAPNDIWAGGHPGLLYHYNGTEWRRVMMDPSVQIYELQGFSSVDVYALGFRANDPNIVQANYNVLFHYDGTEWRAIDSVNAGSIFPSFGTSSLGVIGTYLYTLGPDVFVRRGAAWQREYAGAGSFVDMFSTGGTNALAVASNSEVAHFDGSTWQRIALLSDFDCYFSGVWMTPTEAFILGETSGKSILVYGH